MSSSVRQRAGISTRQRMMLGLVLFASALVASASDAFYTSHIQPLFKDRCLDCHNATKTRSGLDLSTLQTILRGGERGSAVVPGKPNESTLYKFLDPDADPHMPPGKRKPLNDEEIALIKKWIEDWPVVSTPGTSESSAGAAATSSLALPIKAPLSWQPPTNMPPARVVDRFLELAWKRDKIQPASRIDDAAFVRRIYLDLAGRIPSAEETASFVSSKTKNKRNALVDTLLASDDYPQQMREIFDSVLMSRRGANWEEKRANEQWFAFLEDAFRRNRPWNEVVRDLIIARPERPEDRGAVWYLYERQNSAQAIAEALGPVVFGVQVKCAQCHDHMIAREIKQAHYWGMVAAFNRSKNVDTPNGLGVSESAIGGFASFANLKKESQPAMLTFFNGRTVDEVRPTDKEVDSADLYVVAPPKGKDRPQQPAVPKFSRRAAFADATTRDNPLLARAFVNRIWALLFGRGLVHPVELMDSKHPPSHPELLDWLARDFERSDYDVKRLIRTLCNTKAYQLDSRLNRTGKAKPADQDSFSRALDKPLSAEQLFRTLLVATGNQPDADGKIAGRTEKELRRAFVGQFPDLFPAEYNATLYQAMFLSNSALFDDLLALHEGNLAARLAALPEAGSRVRQAFTAVFGREPEQDELRECVTYLKGRSSEAGVKQLLWAMLTSAEVQLNH